MKHPISCAAAVAVLLGVTVPGASAAAEKQPEPADNPVVATVNGVTIHRAEVEVARGRLPQQFQELDFAMLFPVLLNSLIDTRLMAEEGRKAGMQDDPEVKSQMRRIEDQLIERVYLSRYINARLSPVALRAHYDKMVKEMGSQQEVRARHILVEREGDAKTVIAEIDKGADFAELAKKRSTGPSAANGGDLGFFSEGQMVPAFSEAAFKLGVGEVSKEPVQTQFGWHVIKVEGRRDLPPPTFEESEEQLRGELSREIGTELINELRRKATVQRFNLDGSPAADPAPAAPGKVQ